MCGTSLSGAKGVVGRGTMPFAPLRGVPPLPRLRPVVGGDGDDLKFDRSVQQASSGGHGFQRHSDGGKPLPCQFRLDTRGGSGQHFGDQLECPVHDWGRIRSGIEPFCQLGTDLADPLSGDAESSADFRKRVLPTVIPAVISDENLPVSLGWSGGKDVDEFLLQRHTRALSRREIALRIWTHYSRPGGY